MSKQAVLTKKVVAALAELQNGTGPDELPWFVQELENYLLDDPGLYEDQQRCVKMVPLLKVFRYYSGIILRLVEKGGDDEE